MAPERGIGDAVDESRVLSDEVFERFVIALALTARQRYGLAQNCLSRHQSFDLIHEDRWTVGFVRIFLKKNVAGDGCLREDNVKPARSRSPRG
jgi:hypothetical protein